MRFNGNRTFEQYIARTAQASSKLVDLVDTQRARFTEDHSIVTFCGVNQAIGGAKLVNAEKVFRENGIDLSGSYPVRTLIPVIASILGTITTETSLNMISTSRNVELTSVVPAKSFAEQVGVIFERNTKKAVVPTKGTKKGKKSRRRTRNRGTLMINMSSSRNRFFNWITGAGRIYGVENNLYLMKTVYTVAPSVQDIETLKKAQTYGAIHFVLVNKTWIRVAVSRQLPRPRVNNTRPTILDIETSTHAVPYTSKIKTLVRQGYLPASEFGVEDVQTLLKRTFSKGLAFTHYYMGEVIGRMNSVNNTITGAAEMVEITKKGITAEAMERVAELQTKVYDGVNTDTVVDDLTLVGVGAQGSTPVIDLPFMG